MKNNSLTLYHTTSKLYPLYLIHYETIDKGSIHVKNIDIIQDISFIKSLDEKLEQDGPFSSWELFKMAYDSEITTITRDFHGLRALEFLPHMSFSRIKSKPPDRQLKK